MGKLSISKTLQQGKWCGVVCHTCGVACGWCTVFRTSKSQRTETGWLRSLVECCANIYGGFFQSMGIPKMETLYWTILSNWDDCGVPLNLGILCLPVSKLLSILFKGSFFHFGRQLTSKSCELKMLRKSNIPIHLCPKEMLSLPEWSTKLACRCRSTCQVNCHCQTFCFSLQFTFACSLCRTSFIAFCTMLRL